MASELLKFHGKLDEITDRVAPHRCGEAPTCEGCYVHTFSKEYGCDTRNETRAVLRVALEQKVLEFTGQTRRAFALYLAGALGGCSSCEYDEAEGDLVNHCDKCCREVTTRAFALATRKETP